MVFVFPFADPQVPFSGALQAGLLAPPFPLHVQVQEPPVTTVTAEAVPVAQRFVVGAVVTPTPLAVPQEPVVYGAEHDIVVPPKYPVHDHSQADAPL